MWSEVFDKMPFSSVESHTRLNQSYMGSYLGACKRDVQAF
jgi:hypothetical protein